MDLHRRDAYIVAVAPAVVFLGVYAYENGRYYFLKVAPEFIDLSLNRLLAGGAVIGALAVTLVGFTLWMWRYSANGRLDKRLLAAFLALSVFVALPVLLWLQEVPSFLIKSGPPTLLKDVIAMLVGFVSFAVASAVVDVVRRSVERTNIAARIAAINANRSADIGAKGAIGRAAKDEADTEVQGVPQIQAGKQLSKRAPVAFLSPWKFLAAIGLLFWTAVVFAGLGYRVERSYNSRLCLADRFVADVRGDSLLLKSFNPKTGEILSPIEVVETNGIDLDKCSPRLVGASGLVLWP